MKKKKSENVDLTSRKRHGYLQPGEGLNMDITSPCVTLYGRWPQTFLKQYFVGGAGVAGWRGRQAGGEVFELTRGGQVVYS